MAPSVLDMPGRPMPTRIGVELDDEGPPEGDGGLEKLEVGRRDSEREGEAFGVRRGIRPEMVLDGEPNRSVPLLRRRERWRWIE